MKTDLIELFVGDKVKDIREKRKLSQAAFSRELNVDQVRLSYLENNKRKLTIPLLISFSNLLGKSMDETFKLLTSKKGKKNEARANGKNRNKNGNKKTQRVR